MPFAYLALAILAEVVGTSALKASNGFTVWAPSAVVVVAYRSRSTSCRSRCARSRWAWRTRSGAASGSAPISAIGWVAFRQRLDAAALTGIALIIAGVAVINLFSSTVRA